VGTWGVGIFANDAAADFLGELREGPATAVGDRISGAIRAVELQGETELEDDTVSEALVALVLLASGEHPELLDGDDDGEETALWWHRLGIEMTPALRQVGRGALNRIRVPQDNEWYELRAEPGTQLRPEWAAVLDTLSQAYAG
jgi:hypothetical protein